ncbi:hypothetical protein [Streptacidiphilus sp. EB129]|jgi:hypothetical protein|uniref:hypothetical protein n=1 Tax=Streptacidiphilus sp. EB129 TaxID=3156262 RepID=UPI003518456E
MSATGTTGETLAQWFAEHLPEGLFEETPEITVDREEITVVGRIAAGESAETAVDEFRERTRGERIAVAREAERRFGRKVSWGVRHEDTRVLFTHLAVPAMTRLKQPERQVLDTLVAGGVARSRSEALAWCVRQVGENADTWLGDLREALRHVQDVRRQGPDTRA